MSYSSLFKCFASNNNGNKQTILKDLTEAVEDHENWTSVIEDTIIINLGATEEIQEIKIGKSLIPEEWQEFISHLREFRDVYTSSYKRICQA